MKGNTMHKPADKARLVTAATNALQNAKGNFRAALAQFSAVLDDDAALRLALVEDYLSQCMSEMRGESLRSGGQSNVETRNVHAATTQFNTDGEGQQTRAAAAANDPLPSPSVPVRSHERQAPRATHSRPALTPKPNPPRGRTAIMSIQPMIAQTLLDTYKIDGRAIGDFAKHELSKLAYRKESDARILRFLDGYAANVASEAKVRDFIKLDVLKNAIEFVGGASVAA